MLPWNEMEALQLETETIQHELISLNKAGFLTINSQPAVNGSPSEDPQFGWGGANGCGQLQNQLSLFAGAYERLRACNLPLLQSTMMITRHESKQNGFTACLQSVLERTSSGDNHWPQVRVPEGVRRVLLLAGELCGPGGWAEGPEDADVHGRQRGGRRQIEHPTHGCQRCHVGGFPRQGGRPAHRGGPTVLQCLEGTCRLGTPPAGGTARAWITALGFECACCNVLCRLLFTLSCVLLKPRRLFGCRPPADCVMGSTGRSV